MKAVVNIGGSELIISRDWFTGHFTYKYRGEKRVLRAWWNSSTHNSFDTKYEFNFILESPEGEKKVIIEQERKRILAPLFPFTYKIYVDGKLEKDIKSY